MKIQWNLLENLLLALEVGYSSHNNPYHNTIHATDVTQTAHYMLTQTGLAVCIYLFLLFLEF